MGPYLKPEMRPGILVPGQACFLCCWGESRVLYFLHRYVSLRSVSLFNGLLDIFRYEVTVGNRSRMGRNSGMGIPVPRGDAGNEKRGFDQSGC